MQDVVAGEVAQLPVALTSGGQPVLPDPGTISYTLRDHSGVVIDEAEVPSKVGVFQFVIEIAPEHNQLAVTKRFERRTIHLRYEQNGIARGQRLQYRIIPYLNHSVTPHEVRSFLGVNETELPDEDIKLLDAYLLVEKALDQATLERHLDSGTTAEMAANMMIRMQAVLDVIPSLKLRVAQEERSGQKMFSRPVVRDFDALKQEAVMRSQAAMNELVVGLEVPLTLIVATQDPDPITQGG